MREGPREDPRARLLFFVFVTIPKGQKAPGRHIRQLRADFIPRRGVRRPVERNVLILVRREKGTYYPRFGAATLGNGAATCLFVFYFFFRSARENSSARRPRRNRAAVFAVTTTLEAVC